MSFYHTLSFSFKGLMSLTNYYIELHVSTRYIDNKTFTLVKLKKQLKTLVYST